VRTRRQAICHIVLYALSATALVALSPADVSGGVITQGVAVPRAMTSTVAGSYIALFPTRITDTRTGSGYPNAGETLGTGDLLNVQVSGAGKVPAGGVSAVVLNVTVVGPTASSYVTLFPEGTTQPIVSNLNFTPGETLANLATVSLGTQGGVTVFNHAGNVNVVIDVEGYYTTTPQATGLYNPVNPFRVLGSLASGTSIGPDSSSAVTVVGVDGVPDDASAVVANVTASGSSGSGFLTAFPTPDSGPPSPPTVSNVNFVTGQAIANRVIIPVGGDGQINVFNNSGTVKVDVDLDGYYTGSPSELGSAFTPIGPFRFTDTRVYTNGRQILPDASESFSFLNDGIATTATALVANITVVAGDSAGYITVYPTTDYSTPGVSDVNVASDATDQNLTLVPLNGGAVNLYNSSSVPVDILVDAFGSFAPPPRAVSVTAEPSTLTANVSSSSAITVTVTTGSGVAFDDPVSLTTTPNVTGSCGPVSATGSTNASGQVMSTYTGSQTPGTCTITATEAYGDTTGSVVITQTAPT
jgi:hypothetical protein